VVAFAQIMRGMVIQVYRAGAIAGSQAEKSAELFRFISSTEFALSFDTLSENIEALEGLLSRERDSHRRTWAERSTRYQNVSATVVESDERFKSLLESNAKKGSVRVLTRKSAWA
jgi:hypothetical protein